MFIGDYKPLRSWGMEGCNQIKKINQIKEKYSEFRGLHVAYIFNAVWHTARRFLSSAIYNYLAVFLWYVSLCKASLTRGLALASSGELKI